MTTIQKIFKYQIWHLLSIIFSIFTIILYLLIRPDILNGSFLSITTNFWFWLAIASPIIHQIYVWFVWRLELHLRLFSKRLGVVRAFNIYAVGFSLLFISRLVLIVFLAISSKKSLQIAPIFSYLLALFIMPPVIYLFYSVVKYFTAKRAYGIDHFDKDYNKPYVKQGIFKYCNNGMYIFGLMILYLPGLLLLSEQALLVALFNHIYIWVHYYFTERPDMVEIYGKTP